MSPRELLELEMERRGRAWGSVNPERIAHMRAEVSHLHRRPKLRAAMNARHFGGKSAIGWGDGCYMRSRGSIDFARAKQGVD